MSSESPMPFSHTYVKSSVGITLITRSTIYSERRRLTKTCMWFELKTRRLEKSGVFILLKACQTGFFHGKPASPKFQFSSPGRRTWGIFNPWHWFSVCSSSVRDYTLPGSNMKPARPWMLAHLKMIWQCQGLKIPQVRRPGLENWNFGQIVLNCIYGQLLTALYGIHATIVFLWVDAVWRSFTLFQAM
jgi:hypothetical protein